MSDWRAPMAMRTPISRVRSVTDTSMMFITPMPPTSSAIMAMAETSSVSVVLVRVMAWRIWSEFQMKKSLVPWRSVSRLVAAFCAISAGTASLMRSVMLSRWYLPTRRVAAAV